MYNLLNWLESLNARVWYHLFIYILLNNFFKEMATIKIEMDHNPFVKNSNVFSYKKDINKWIYLELYHKIILYHKINLLNFYMLTWPLRLFFHNFIPERCTRLFFVFILQNTILFQIQWIHKCLQGNIPFCFNVF